MQITLRRVFGATLIAVTALAAATGAPALAGRRIPAMSGIAQRPSEATCFANGNGNITNNACAGAARRFCLPLSWDYNVFGNFANVTIAARTPPNTTLSCFTVVTDKFGNATSSTGLQTIPNDNVFHDVAMQAGGIPDQGSVFSCCDIPLNGVISVANY